MALTGRREGRFDPPRHAMTIRVTSSIVLRLAGVLMAVFVALAIGQQLLSKGLATLLVAVLALPAMIRIAMMKVQVDDDRMTVVAVLHGKGT